jgi:hypothetical protein
MQFYERRKRVLTEMEIEEDWLGKFIFGLTSEQIEKIVKKKFGYNVNIQLNNFKVTQPDGVVHVHLNADAELSKEELKKIIKKQFHI